MFTTDPAAPATSPGCPGSCPAAAPIGGARSIASTRSTQKPTPASGGRSSRDRGARERGQSRRRRRSCPDAALPGRSSVTPPTVSEHATSLKSQLLIRARFFILIPVIRAHLVSSADRFTGARHDHEGQVQQQWRHLSSPVTGIRTHTEQNQGMRDVVPYRQGTTYIGRNVVSRSPGHYGSATIRGGKGGRA
jgi:hypothetical protein